MATKSTKKRPKDDSTRSKAFELRRDEKADPQVHVFGDGIVCDTEKRGYPTPDNLNPARIVVDASEGFIPLWARGTTLRYRFRDRSLRIFRNPAAAKAEIKRLMGEAILAWGNAAPVRFTEQNDAWDFEIVMRSADDCDANGCVLASAFFPDPGRHVLELYPRMFTQPRKEQVDTFIHEIGHVFGLRHFFAQVQEAGFPSEVFGTHSRFSIMNYGADSSLTSEDRADLRRLYLLAWSGQLTQINGTPIRFVRPFHTIGAPTNNVVAGDPFQMAAQPAAAAYICEP